MPGDRIELTWVNKEKALLPMDSGQYGYSWVDPCDDRVVILPSLVLDRYVQGKQFDKESGVKYSQRADLEPQSENLMILGESGQALRVLTQDPLWSVKYVNKVQAVYLDPPFNTASNFFHYDDKLDHCKWLTMMRERLLLLHTLLSPSGSIWVHLDDVENHRIRCLLDEIFGSHNYLSSINVQVNPKGRQLGGGLARTDDMILVYAKDRARLRWNTGFAEEVSLEDFPKRSDQGVPFRYLALRNTNKKFNPSTSPTLYYPLYAREDNGKVDVEPFPGAVEVYPVFGDGEPAVWRWSAQKVREQSEQLHARIVRGRTGRRLDIFQIDCAHAGRTKKLTNHWNACKVGSNDTAKQELKALFPQALPFSTPKPEALLARIIRIASDPGDLVVDMFAGSGTTAAVAQKLGRRWVTCELLESTFNQYTLPRLEKVVNNQDPGGESVSKGQRVPVYGIQLPEGLTPNNAQEFNRALSKVLKELPELKNTLAVQALRAATRTQMSSKIVNWRGGGGFQIAHLEYA